MRPGVRTTAIPGLLLVDLAVNEDARGWFKENWQREKMVGLGLPDFRPVQQNVSLNETVGTTRGIHAEPWDKLVSVVSGSVFAAWVDLREGKNFGTVVTAKLDAYTAAFVPRGVGNAFQTTEYDTVYSYLVNDHWSADAEYTFVNLADAELGIEWPIPLERAVMSEKDRDHPKLSEVEPIRPRRILVLGANGQVGRALRKAYRDHPGVDFAGRAEYDLGHPRATEWIDWRRYDTVINAAAYTRVDEAESWLGRREAWAVNAAGVARLARACADHNITLVHISTDYVFDGTDGPHTEDEDPSPLGVYGQSKAAGDMAVSVVPKHYIVRTSWVVGDGQNFVRTMAKFAGHGSAPQVVDDQRGRLTFASDIANAIRHLLESEEEYGIYNVTSSGDAQTWAEVADDVFLVLGSGRGQVSRCSTEEFYRGATKPVSPRPKEGTLSIRKLLHTGYGPRNAHYALRDYLTNL